MSISVIAAVATKEVASHAVREAATQVGREIAQKMAMEAGTQATSGTELQTSMLEQQTSQEGFHIGEMSETKGEEREFAKQKESDAADELRGKLDAEQNGPDAKEVQPDKASETEVSEMAQGETAETQEMVGEAEQSTIHTNLESVSENEPISYDIITRNQSLEGEVHPVTGVSFERRTIIDAEGNRVTGVFAKFESFYDAKLPENMLKASDKEQFTESNRQLGDAVTKEPETAKKFSSEQLEQIKNGDTPDGYTWHHNEEPGKMQLLESDTHAKTGHTGGRSIWGGGSEFRS